MPHTEVSLIKQAIAEKKLVVILGTGVSNSLTESKSSIYSWTGLVESAFNEIVQLGYLSQEKSDMWKVPLHSTDIDEVLSAAELVGRKMCAPEGDIYARWLSKTFSAERATNISLLDAFRRIVRSGTPIATLNYDTLLEDGLNLQSILAEEVRDTAEWIKGKTQTVLHLHGHWRKPASCVLGIRDYASLAKNEYRNLLQRTLTSFSNILFIGCGATFKDPNFSQMASWLRANLGGQGARHFLLTLEGDLTARKKDQSLLGFVEPISYGQAYDDLPSFLCNLFEVKKSTTSRKTSTRAVATPDSSVLEQLINNYRAFMLRDCGQMTIEGLRADMDTAQRKFDLEKLFVPLTVNQAPPFFPERDPDREKKLEEWIKAHGAPLSFGDAMTKSSRIALLALPGGGKTLLLKRLSVAYSDANRRNASPDNLPNLDLLPALLRCREWRAEIRKPISEILERIPEQAGAKNLSGFKELVTRKMTTGGLLLMVDGLDEIHDDADRAIFVENLEKFLADYPKTKLVVTSREAGFELIAPVLSRFCDKYKIAPLDEPSVRDLCLHWHRLMAEDQTLAEIESTALVDQLLRQPALRRLAENPLLLTMLLVVKHGAGRLPPDRVSLYERAVEVLIDTWNIKGHAPLGLKEAMPQLACIAFELMENGRQTATKSELVAILEEARIRLPNIGRYSKDSPEEFLRRVELRSSLLLEGGRQADGKSTVPFYQFRHLTFQEYLAAYAASEGVYLNYEQGADLLRPLGAHYTTSEWKEVIPMAAVLAKKQATPLIHLLLNDGLKLKNDFCSLKQSAEIKEWIDKPGRMPFVVVQLMRCLVEEADIAPQDVGPIVQVIASFAHGCGSDDDWQALCEGPYGADLLAQSINLYKGKALPAESWIRNTCCVIAARRRDPEFWETAAGSEYLGLELDSGEEKRILEALLIIMGVFWISKLNMEPFPETWSEFRFERWLDSPNDLIAELASWAWGARERRNTINGRLSKGTSIKNKEIFDRIVVQYFSGRSTNDIFGYALSSMVNHPRASWTPNISLSQKREVLSILKKIDSAERVHKDSLLEGAWTIAYFSRILPDNKLAALLNNVMSTSRIRENKTIRKELGSIPAKTRKKSPQIAGEKITRKRAS